MLFKLTGLKGDLNSYHFFWYPENGEVESIYVYNFNFISDLILFAF